MAKTWSEKLMVPLQMLELLERGESLALQDRIWAKKDAERKAAVDRFKAELAEIESETARLAQIVRDKQEPRPVDVTEVHNFTENRVDVVRTDTGEVVRTRVMEERERQLALLPKIEPSVAAESEEPAVPREEARERHA